MTGRPVMAGAALAEAGGWGPGVSPLPLNLRRCVATARVAVSWSSYAPSLLVAFLVLRYASTGRGGTCRDTATIAWPCGTPSSHKHRTMTDFSDFDLDGFHRLGTVLAYMTLGSSKYVI